jgi:hypothetical protein
MTPKNIINILIEPNIVCRITMQNTEEKRKNEKLNESNQKKISEESIDEHCRFCRRRDILHLFILLYETVQGWILKSVPKYAYSKRL